MQFLRLVFLTLSSDMVIDKIGLLGKHFNNSTPILQKKIIIWCIYSFS